MTGFISADQKNLYTFIFERKGRGSKMDMEDTSKLKIFTGNAHPALAKEISTSECRWEKLSADGSTTAKFRS